ncbi:hypothetical protein BVRB_3g053230 [Beta vulgaris subsp. vulgaris]|nr:hypothetical protein BVRB_3g053230 [Beta vulgaris subsp. vulgaris]
MEEIVVMYPAPGLSHIVPLVEFGKRLLSYHPCISITFLIPTLPFDYNTDTTSSYISSVSSSFPSITFFYLPIPSLPRHPAAYLNTEDLFFELGRLNNPNVSAWFLSLPLCFRVSAFIIDFFCTSALDMAVSFNIPVYFFFATGASTVALFLNFPVIDKIMTGKFRGAFDAEFSIEGLPLVPATALPEPMLDRGPTYNEFINVGLYLSRSQGVIVNTFQELEHRVVKALYEGACLPVGFTTPPVYCVGPLVSSLDYDGGTNTTTVHECLSWLDSKPKQSVVFVCFGSVALFQQDQLKEIAQGLEKSMQRFLWVVRDPPPLNEPSKRFTKPPEPDLEKILHGGFLDRTKERGMVVKSWAPQKAILSHSSVGAFVTHCGWNSTLEAVSAGVPLVAWPLFAEQRFNKVVLVEEVKVAVAMEEREEGGKFVTAEEVEMRVREIMESDVGERMRKKMLVIKDQAKVAISEGGSSSLALAKFVDSWDNNRGCNL